MVDTIKFSQMTDGGDIDNNKKTPGLKSGGNVLFNNPWTFLPPGDTASRPTPSAEVNYRLRLNTEEQLYEYYDAILGVWTQLQASAFTQGPFVIYTADPSIPDGQNLGILADGILIQTITAGVATIDILSIPLRGAKGGTGIDNGILTIDLTGGSTGYVMTSDSSGNATWAPAGYLTDAVLLNPSGNQTITAHNLSLATGSMFATLGTFSSGSATGGAQGKFTAFSTTAAMGSTTLQAADNAGDYANILTNASTSAARTWTLPDASGTVALTGSSVQTINGDSGSATPSGGVITFTGTGSGLTFSASGSTVTLDGGAALTKTDDTNVTLTLGGSASTSLVHAASLTLGWTGQLSETRGGTAQSTYTLGDTLYASAANTLSKLAGNITAVKQYLSQTGTGAVSAAPVWATIDGGDITGAALTKTDDTNVTLTLGGSPSTALLRAASLTLGWTGQLGLTRGGTAASLTASNGGLVYSTSTALAILAAGSTGQIPRSGGAGAPTWSTATYPSAAGTIGNVLTSDGTNWISSAATGSGTVTSGLQNQLTWYAANGTTVSGLAIANNGVLITSSGGVPSISSTLPSGIAATNMNLTTPTIGAASATSITFSSTTGIVGTTTNNNAAAGSVGELISSVISSGTVNLSSGTSANITSISLTAGDWDVWGNVGVAFAVGGGSNFFGWISTTSATKPDQSLYSGGILAASSSEFSLVVPGLRASLSGTTTYYLSCNAGGFAGTSLGCGGIYARRVR